MTNIARLRTFVQSFTRLMQTVGGDESRVLADGRTLLRDLITHDDWLPPEFARPDMERYRQYLLYCDPLERFSVVSFVWAPAQTTPIHDHTVWGMVGVMRGTELCEEFQSGVDGRLTSTGLHQAKPGDIDLVSPSIGDIHKVSNDSDRVSVSIHVYGANIGAVRRSVYDRMTGQANQFISGYSSTTIPNIWDRSIEAAPTDSL